jgi:transcriptional regulator with XRE-family HTH domain
VNFSDADEQVSRVVKELAAIRKAAGLTPYRLAELTGLTREAIRLIEKGDRSPTLHSLLLISAALGTKLGPLLSRSEGK